MSSVINNATDLSGHLHKEFEVAKDTVRAIMSQNDDSRGIEYVGHRSPPYLSKEEMCERICDVLGRLQELVQGQISIGEVIIESRAE